MCNFGGIVHQNFVNWLLEEASNMVMIFVKSSILKLPQKNN